MPPDSEGVRLRIFRGHDDVDRWLALRREAFDVVGTGGREWDAADFEREFLQKPDWSPERMWLAVHCAAEDWPGGGSDRVVGSVYLSVQGEAAGVTGVMRWLMVAPGSRRRGVGRLLVATLEADCWRRGIRRVTFETHSDWAAATAFYASLGYAKG